MTYDRIVWLCFGGEALAVLIVAGMIALEAAFSG
jgi:hypothetical protein